MRTTILLAALISSFYGYSFCGFYVAKADAKLFNKSSKVIYVRDGDRSVITMANDYQGELRDFAMVVPVPVVLDEEDIKVIKNDLLERLNAYSAPRLAEYYDSNPCYQAEYGYMVMEDAVSSVRSGTMANKKRKRLGVKIEAEYLIGEYDIKILSAKRSNGLEIWLTENGYKIPENAREVLTPYIKDKMKFFVVKVNLDKMKGAKEDFLSPIQISFESDKIMLPIRLGMANAKNTQDLIIYAFTKNGRLETANYRTIKMPSDMNVPEFVEHDFNDFYTSVFDKAYEDAGRDAVFTEYAWDISSSNFVKCDPCATQPPSLADLKQAGVFWINEDQTQNYGDVYFTRLHVRYDRQHFPEDLQFQITPDKSRHQCRYVLNRPVKGDLSCDEATSYLEDLINRRKRELENYEDLTGNSVSDRKDYYSTYVRLLEKRQSDEKKNSSDFLFWLIGLPPLLGFLLMILNYLRFRKFQTHRIFSWQY